jgi:hypothetical protein
MSTTSKKYIYINTAPKANTKKDGSVFYTVLVGLSKALLAEANAEAVDTVTMQVFENQLEDFTRYYNACKKAGAKLALACDAVVITEPKANNYINRDGEMVSSIQASCWADGPSELTVLKGTMSVSDELKSLLDNDGDDDITV